MHLFPGVISRVCVPFHFFLLSISGILTREFLEEEVFSPAAVLGGGGAGAPEARVFCTTAPARRLCCVQADPNHPLVRSTAPSRR